MTKAYWITSYHQIVDPAKLAPMQNLRDRRSNRLEAAFSPAPPPLSIRARRKERTVLIEFPSVEQAVAAHDSPAYRAASTPWVTAPSGICA